MSQSAIQQLRNLSESASFARRFLFRVWFSHVWDFIALAGIVTMMSHDILQNWSQPGPIILSQTEWGVLLISLAFILARGKYYDVVFHFFIHREELLWTGMDMDVAQDRALRRLARFRRWLLRPVIEQEQTLCSCNRSYLPCRLHRPEPPCGKREMSS